MFRFSVCISKLKVFLCPLSLVYVSLTLMPMKIKQHFSYNLTYPHAYLFNIALHIASHKYPCQIMLSCQSTEPAGELHQYLSVFLCILPSLLAEFGPAIAAVSTMAQCCLHSPGWKSRLAFSARSSCWFCKVGYLEAQQL